MILSSPKDINFSFSLVSLVLRKLTNMVPNEQVHLHDWPHLKGLEMADPEYYQPGRIDCILGAEVYASAILDGLRKGPSSSPLAQRTVFGWVLTGPIKPSARIGSKVSCHLTQSVEPIAWQLQKFWEVEEPPQSTRMTPEEAACEDNFQKTHQRDNNGRFVVRLPFKQIPMLPGIQDIAKARLLNYERRLNANPQLQAAYVKFMKEYLDLHHMERVPDEELQRGNCSYIPHHGVLKADGSGKLRVVFNASQQAKNGKSLNDYLHTGPKLQAELSGVLTRWRLFRFVFTAEIVKMFRQFDIHEADRDWLRILWRPSQSEPIQTYRLRTVTYGTAPAPYQAIRCLKQLASDETVRYPRGAEILLNHSYVDDNLGGGYDLNSAIQARNELIGILASAGMQLDKWSTNDQRIISDLSETSNQELAFEEVVSTLGLRWNSKTDTFQFRVRPQVTLPTVTKRTMLSEIASLFDPLGWLAPVIITAKVYIQELWIRQLDWDQQVHEDLHQAWKDFKAQLPNIERIQIPRWVYTTGNSPWELHGFADASERAYAAVLYLVHSGCNGTYHISLITAKTKVAPVKKLSIPRLELCAAQLLSRLIHSTSQQLIENPSKVFCWSDSKTAMAWLQGHPSRWHTFVANRVSEINSLTEGARWGHVSSAQNPADLATRGATPTQLEDSDLWWYGPEWLRLGPSHWPHNDNSALVTEEEIKCNTKIFQTTVQDTRLYDWISRYSSLSRLTRLLSFLFLCKTNSNSLTGAERELTPTARHRAAALNSVIRVSQRHFFKEEIDTLEKGKLLRKSSSLRSLNPFLSPDGILRVGGRLQHSSITYDEKHPAIIPKDSHLASLLIRDAHIRTLHGGAQLVQSTLRQKYWIIHYRSLIRASIRNCIKCLRFQGQVQQQLMAPLPAVRLHPARPFTYTGVDYAGPFNTRAYRGRGHTSFKSYVAVFVCMVTRAVHLELVSDYTTRTFLAAFRRFTSRRGMCHTVYSDHGTTF